MKEVKIYLLTATFFLLILLPTKIFAGDYATLSFIGFSNNGKYLAFEEYGTQDGSGFPYSNIFIVDVLKNSLAAPPVRKLIQKETVTSEAIRLEAKKAAAVNLKKYKIVSGNTGELVVARLLTDLNIEKLSSGDDSKNQIVNFTDYRESNYFENEFELSLKTSEVKIKGCDYSDLPILKFELLLKDVRKDTEKILQKDEKLPESRNCPHAYSIQNVYVYENRIAIFLNVYTTGFEGPDMRFMVVTGIYK